jgi:hypothetical protein
VPTNPIAPSPCHRPGAATPVAVSSHAPGGGPAAPAWRGLSPLRDLTGLAGADRAAAHRANVRVRDGDAAAYAQYLEAWLDGARRCRTAAELRAYGRPAAPSAGLERGATLAEDRDLDIAGSYGRQVHASLAAHGALSELILRLERRPVPLDAFFDAALTVRVESGGRAWGGTVSSRGGAVAEAGSRAVTVQPGRTEVGVDAGIAAARAALSGGRLDAVEVSVPALPGVRAFSRLSRGAVEQGMAVGGAVGGTGGAPGVRVEARASVGVTLLTAEVARWALSRRSFWDGQD